MPREQQDPKTPKKTVKLIPLQDPPSATRHYAGAWRAERATEQQVPQTSTKSRYKIYNEPGRSTFSVTLDNMKRERESMVPPGRKIDRSRSVPARRRLLPQATAEEQAGPSTKPSIVRGGSIMGIERRKSHYFKDVFSEYMKKRQAVVSLTPRRLRILKFHVPRNLDEALDASIQRFTPPRDIPSPWRQPRLQWLEKLEQEVPEPPKSLPPDEKDEGRTVDCFMWLCPYRKRKSI